MFCDDYSSSLAFFCNTLLFAQQLQLAVQIITVKNTGSKVKIIVWRIQLQLMLQRVTQELI